MDGLLRQNRKERCCVVWVEERIDIIFNDKQVKLFFQTGDFSAAAEAAYIHWLDYYKLA